MSRRVLVMVFLTAAMGCLRAGEEPPEVVRRYEEMLLRSPSVGPAFEKVYQHFLSQGGLEALAARWEGRAEAGGEDAAACWLLLGHLEERRGRQHEAGAAFQKAAELQPELVEGWMALGDHLVSAGKLAEAAAAYEKGLELVPSPAAAQELFRKLAIVRQRELKPEEALRVWERMVQAFPDDPYALEEVGMEQLRAEKWARARETFQKLEQLSASDPYRRVTVAMRLGEIDEHEGRSADAVRRYEALLAETSERSWMHREIRRLIEDTYRRTDDLPGLVEYYQDRLEDAPRDVEASRALALALLELGRRQEGLAALEKAVGLAPDRGDLQLELARRYREAGKAEQAARILERYVAGRSDDLGAAELLGETYWQLAQDSDDGKGKDQAIAAWRRTIPQEGATSAQMQRLAGIFRQHGLHGEAISELEKAIAADPANNDAREQLVQIHREREDAAAAEAVLVEMTADKRATPENFLRVARMRKQAGEWEQALAAVENGLRQRSADFDLLSLKWLLLTETNRWADAVRLYPALSAAAPNDYFAAELEGRHLVALGKAGQLDEFRKSTAAKFDAGGEVDRRDVRLLVRAHLLRRDHEAASRVLAEAQKRSPGDASLVRLQAEYHRAMRETPERIAALRRLVELEPARKAEWLREMVAAWRDAGDLEQAVAAAEEVVAHNPASADGLVLYADLCFAAGREEEAVLRLRQAVKFSDRPNDLRLRLARHAMDTGRTEEAIALYEEAFENETEPAARLNLIRPLAEAYFQAGRSEDLVRRFEQRQRAEAGGWRYAMYLAAIHAQLQDWGSARRELSRVLADRARDPDLLRQLVRLAEAEGNTAEAVRYQEMLALLEPTTPNKLALASAYLADGRGDRALEIARENARDLLEQPESLREMVHTSNDPEFAAQLAQLFAKDLRANEQDWQGRMALADFYLADRDYDKAAEVLWEVMAIGGDNQLEGLLAGSAPPKTVGLMQRLAAAQQMRNVVMQRLMGQPQAPVLRGQRARWTGTGGIEGAWDSAVVTLGMLALQSGEAKDFMEKLEQALDDRMADVRERILAYAILETKEPLLAAVKEYVEDRPEDPEIDQMAAMVLRNYAYRQDGGDESGLIEVLDRIHQRIGSRDARARLVVAQMRYDLLSRLQRNEEAKAVVDEALGEMSSDDPADLHTAAGLALRVGRTEDALRYFEQVAAVEKDGTPVPPQSTILAMQLVPALAIELGDDAKKNKEAQAQLRRLFGHLLERVYAPAGGAPVRGRGGPVAGVTAGFSAVPAGRRLLRYQMAPSPNEFFDFNQVSLLQQLFNVLPSAPARELLAEEINAQEKRFPAERRIYPQLARVYMDWWSGDQDAALVRLGKVRAAHPSRGLELMEAGMLLQAQRPKDAMERLKGIGPEAGDDHIDALFLTMQAARALEDAALAQETIAKFGGQNLDPAMRIQLAEVLRYFGMTQEAEGMVRSGRQGSQGRPQDRMRQMQEELSKYRSPEDKPKAVALARRILSENPLGPAARGYDYVRRQALQSLRHYGEAEAYLEELAAELERSPNSPRFHMQLAEGYQEIEPAKAIRHWERVAELRPRDFDLQRAVAQQLMQADRSESAVQIYRRLLETDTEATLMRDHPNVVRAFSKARQLDDLIKLLLAVKAPPPHPLRGNSPLVSAFVQLGNELKRQGRLADAVSLWVRGSEQSMPQDFNLTRMIVEALLELDRGDEVMPQLERAFFPKQTMPSVPLFALPQQTRATASYLFVVGGFQGGEMTAPALTLVSYAAQVQGLPRLLEKAREARAAAQGEEAATYDILITLLRIEMRDPALLEETDALTGIDGAGNQRLQHLGVLRLLALRLSEWKEAKDATARFLAMAQRFADADRHDFANRLAVRQDIARLAAEQADTGTARQVLTEAGDILAEQSSLGNRGFQIDQAIEVASAMAELEMDQAAARLIALVKQSPQIQNNEHYRAIIAALESEVALLRGKIDSPTGLLWAEPERSEGEGRVALGFEVRPAGTLGGSGVRPPRFAARGRDYRKLRGRFDLEVLFGPDSDHLRQVAVLKGVGTRGTWEGVLPERAGFVRAAVRDTKTAGAVSFGPAIPVTSHPNLLANAQLVPEPGPAGAGRVPGWEIPGSEVRVSQVSTGGVLDGPVARLRLPQRNQVEIVSDKIPLASGTTYLQGAWLRFDREAGSFAQLGRRYTNAEGRVLKTDWCSPSSDGSGEDIWQWFGQELGHARDSGNPLYDRIPDRATHVQVILRIQGGCAVQGLMLAPFRSEEPGLALR